VAGMYALVFVLYRFGFGRSQGDAAMAALTGSFVSSGIVGLPVMLDIIGPTFTVIPVIVNTILSLVTAVPATILLVQLDKPRTSANLSATLRRTLLDVLKNPLVFAALIGLIWSWLAAPVPDWLHETFEKVGAATFATSLFAVGMGINLSLLRDNLRQILVLSGLRIFLSSAFGFLLALGFDLEPGYALSFVIMASLPTAKSVPPIAQEYGVFAGESVQVVTVTTLSMVIILPIVCYLGNAIWPGIIR
jgi:malonate transporter and related proteins